MLKRIFDFSLAFLLAVILAVPMIVIALAVKLTSRGPALYWSQRVGRGNQLFSMPKFRSMRTAAPVVATHLLSDSSRWITPLGRMLRVSSLDELPQLWCVLTGEMSLVGPRPALYNQSDLIQSRTEFGVDQLRPGITGWAQIHGRDELAIPQKVRLDAEYLQRHSFLLDLKIIAMTFIKVLRQDGVKQADEQSTSSDQVTQQERSLAA